MTIDEFQKRIESQFLARDKARGVGGTFLWFVEEVGELATALRENTDRKALSDEFADVFAWLVSLASISGIRLEEAVAKYAQGCPRCRKTPCACKEVKP
jgi:NTP pyrophosphatase (non-canonical NTP hydrolase)